MKKKRKLVAALACRNNGSRLFGKPLQNLDESKGVKIIDNLIDCIRSIDEIDEIVLGIAEGVENNIFKEIAIQKKINYIEGDEIDVLGRLIKCAEKVNATDVFRTTSENPFLYFQSVKKLWEEYLDNDIDAIFQDDIVDGCGFEIITLSALKESHRKGETKHRSEYCTLYIRENKDKFKIKKIKPDNKLIRKDLRLTVDNPEDLIVCRELYKKFKHQAPMFNLEDLINYMDQNPNLKTLISPYVEKGYESMYL
jgi:spore coat polysaccharide biosynthesis protein SpsF